MSVFHSLESKVKIKELLKREGLKIHFVGVGGVGIYSLFKISARLGYEVTGSDREISSLCNRLIDDGFKIYVGHSKENAHWRYPRIIPNCNTPCKSEYRRYPALNISAYLWKTITSAFLCREATEKALLRL